ncbi:MAG: DUF2752 domain-containing protein [Planctomycetota bacterium]|jgi:hypothetical protein
MKLEVVKVPRRLGWPLFHLGSRLEQPLQLCLFKRISGLPCPTCGFTRGALCVLHGHLGQAWLYNPLLFSALALLFAACLGRVLFARSVKTTLTRTERHAAWILCIALFLCNWAYIILCVG